MKAIEGGLKPDMADPHYVAAFSMRSSTDPDCQPLDSELRTAEGCAEGLPSLPQEQVPPGVPSEFTSTFNLNLCLLVFFLCVYYLNLCLAL